MSQAINSPAYASVSTEDVKHVAELANLELTTEELPRMTRDLSAVLGYIEQLNELDTRAVEPMAQVGDAFGESRSAAGESLRADVLTPSLDRAAVMQEAPDTDNRFFKVPKVIER